MIYQKRHARPKGTIETFTEDGSRNADVVGLVISDMVATVVSGSAVSINAQSYDSAEERLSFQLNFASVGSIALSVTTTFQGSDETIVTQYRFRTLDDGTGTGNDYGL